MTPELLARYDRQVPRYTSYPTAPHFKPAVDGVTYAGWLRAIDPAETASIYLHVPFCREMCWYCGCNTRVVRREGPVLSYGDSLIAEIDRVADAIPARLRAGHVHFGGGSPNMLPPDMLRRIVDRLRDRFDLTAEAEIAVEIDPRSTSGEFIRACAAAGVTRASLGVQELDDDVQRAINRMQSFGLIAQVTAQLRGHGVRDINMDLMYGLPKQNVDTVTATIDRVTELAPTRIALFGYAHVPWMKKHMQLIDEADLPGVAERWQQFEAATERLRQRGYVAIGMDHFAHPDSAMARAAADGSLRRNFQGYTTDSAGVLLAFGASAIGSLPAGYVQNDPDVRRWQAAIAAGGFATVKGCALDDDDRMRRAVIERLMCDMEVDVDSVARRHGGDPATLAPAMDALEPMLRDGLVEIAGTVLRMTPRGRPLVRAAAAAFDRYLRTGPGESPRHARAI
jgi:oxygen-independent coproporphyrinogen-3 oxidase